MLVPRFLGAALLLVCASGPLPGLTVPQVAVGEHVCGPAHDNKPCPAHLPCCSQWGFCGNTAPYCDVMTYKCQYGCWSNSTLLDEWGVEKLVSKVKKMRKTGKVAKNRRLGRARKMPRKAREERAQQWRQKRPSKQPAIPAAQESVGEPAPQEAAGEAGKVEPMARLYAPEPSGLADAPAASEDEKRDADSHVASEDPRADAEQQKPAKKAAGRRRAKKAAKKAAKADAAPSAHSREEARRLRKLSKRFPLDWDRLLEPSENLVSAKRQRHRSAHESSDVDARSEPAVHVDAPYDREDSKSVRYEDFQHLRAGDARREGKRAKKAGKRDRRPRKKALGGRAGESTSEEGGWREIRVAAAGEEVEKAVEEFMSGLDEVTMQELAAHASDVARKMGLMAAEREAATATARVVAGTQEQRPAPMPAAVDGAAHTGGAGGPKIRARKSPVIPRTPADEYSDLEMPRLGVTPENYTPGVDMDLGIRFPFYSFDPKAAGPFNSPIEEPFMRVENPYFDARGLYSSCRVKNAIALTYDDGPSPYTGRLLDTLKAFNFTATFFVLGRNIQTEEDRMLVKRMYDEGHTVASHSFTHANLTQLNVHEIKREMDATASEIASIIGHRPAYMRPPFGEFSELVKTTLFHMGYKIVLWNMDPLDWQYYEDQPDEIYGLIEKNLRRFEPVKEAKSWIPLQHDIFEATVLQQAKVFRLIKQLGYNVVPMTECLGHKSAYQSNPKQW